MKEKRGCLGCKREFGCNELDYFNIRISSDLSYRIGGFFLCVECEDKAKIYTAESIFDSLKEIIEMKEEGK